MNAADYQKDLKQKLLKHFSDVRLEWSISKGASDSMAADRLRYAPRTDIAVGPFSIKPGANDDIQLSKMPKRLVELFKELSPNPNPRCLIAIEVVFSGSSKHMLGDIINASALGKYGIVVGSEDKVTALRRNLEYLKILEEVGKPHFRADNLIVLRVDELSTVLDEI